MDLSFTHFDRAFEVSIPSSDLGLLLGLVAARQAASPTATGYARILRDGAPSPLLAPLHGAFNGPMATAIVKWKEG